MGSVGENALPGVCESTYRSQTLGYWLLSECWRAGRLGPAAWRSSRLRRAGENKDVHYPVQRGEWCR